MTPSRMYAEKMSAACNTTSGGVTSDPIGLRIAARYCTAAERASALICCSFTSSLLGRNRSVVTPRVDRGGTIFQVVWT
jgi:hypothetical protein